MPLRLLKANEGRLEHIAIDQYVSVYDWPAWDSNWTVSAGSISPDDVVPDYPTLAFQSCYTHFASAHAMQRPSPAGEVGSSISGGYTGLVAAPGSGMNHGCLYGIPGTADKVVKFNPNTNTASMVGHSLGTSSTKWWGGVLGSDGCVYGVPYDSTSVLKIDPTTDSVSTFGSVGSGTAKWRGGQIAPNGKLYCSPFNSTNVLVVDLSASSTSTIATGLSGSALFWGNGLTFNDVIVGVPCSVATQQYVIDCSDDSLTLKTFGAEYRNLPTRWAGCVLTPTGELLTMSWAEDGVVITPRGGIWGSYYGTFALEHCYDGMATPGGWIVPCLHDTSMTKIIHPTLLSLHDSGGGGWTTRYGGSCLSTNGYLYWVPYDTGKFFRWKVSGGAIPEDFVLSRYINRSP